MPVFKRIALLVATNVAVMLVLSIVMKVLESAGVFGEGFMRAYGPLMVMAVVVGFGGAFISLLMSKVIAKWSTGAKVLTAPRTSEEAWLLETVRRQADRAGVKMPEVAIYDSPELNAFATGPSKNNSLVAVSTGLLQRMQRDEIEAVLGHEISHVANGDMVTLTLLQGVLNTFVIFAARIVGGLVDSMLSRSDEEGERSGPGIGYWVTTIAAELVFGLLATMIVMWFSRYREFRADAGGASLAGRQKMVAALRRLGQGEDAEMPPAVAAFGIKPAGRGVLNLFRSHPPIEERIRRLQGANDFSNVPSRVS
jgi:heat shock protein HtpX